MLLVYLHITGDILKRASTNPSMDICLSSQHNAILLISIRNLSEDDIKKITKSANKIVKKYKGLILSYIGTCFGHYDVVIEIIGESARVLSDCACNIQIGIDERLIKSKGEGSVCSSLIIGNKIVKFAFKSQNINSDNPIKAFTFIRPTEDINLDDFFKNKLKNSTLYWNPTVFTILLVTEGKSYNDIFRNILEYRLKMGSRIIESSTNFSLIYNPKFGISGDVGESDSNDVTGVIAIKLKKEDDPKEIENKIKNMKNVWCPLLNNNFDLIFNRAGGADYALGIIDNNLTKIRMRVFELRKKFKKNITTSTILFLSNRGEGID